MNIRFRLAIIFSVIVAAIVISFSLYIYISYADFRQEEYYARLTNKAKTTAKLLIKVQEIDGALLKVIDSNTINALYSEKVIVFNEQDELIYSSLDDEIITYSPEILDKIRTEKRLEYRENDNEVVGLLYEEDGSNNIVIASALDFYGKRKLENLQYTLIIGCALSVVLTIWFGLYYARKALKPIVNINNQISEITSTDLNQRLMTGKYKDEIYQLAINFNDMLQRITDSIHAQKNFVSSASHELRTPLAAISSQLQHVLSNPRPSAEYHRVLLSIQEDVQNLIGLTNALLLLSKTEADQPRLPFEEIRVDEVLLNAQMSVCQAHPSFRIHVNFQQVPEQEEQLSVQGLPFLIWVLFSNMMVNACKFSEDHQCWVNINFDQAQVSLAFEDKGIGIPENEIMSVFTPFFRASNASTLQKGYGLGLSLCKKIIDLHQGNIQVTSELGKGSRFTVFLPNLVA